MPALPALREEARRVEDESSEPPRVKRNPGVQAWRGVRLRGGERSQGEETELKMGRLGEE